MQGEYLWVLIYEHAIWNKNADNKLHLLPFVQQKFRFIGGWIQYTTRCIWIKLPNGPSINIYNPCTPPHWNKNADNKLHLLPFVLCSVGEMKSTKCTHKNLLCFLVFTSGGISSSEHIAHGWTKNVYMIYSEAAKNYFFGGSTTKRVKAGLLR